MKKKIFIAAAVLISSSAAAQQDSIRDLNEVVITANKFPNKTSLTGKVLTVITRDMLQASGGKDLSQVLTEQAGLYINGANSNPGKDKSVYLRGARVDHTLIMLDGVPLYDPSGIGSNFDIRLITIDQVERIEILKGSQSTLYGSDAIAGVIHIITRKAALKPLQFTAMAGYGSYRGFKGSASIGGTVKKFDYTVQYAYQSTRGIDEATDTASKPVYRDRDGFNQHSVYAALGFKPLPGIRLQPFFRYTRLKTQYDQGAFTDELDLTNSSENQQAGMKNEIRLGKAQFTLLYQYNRIKRVYTDDSVQSQNGFARFSRGEYRAREHFADLYGVYPITSFLKVTAGIDLRRSESDQSYHSVSLYGPYDSKLGSDSLHQQQLGIYAALAAGWKNGFNVEAGGRYNHHSAYGSNRVYNLNPSFLWREQWKVFVNLATAFKAPTLYQLYSEYGNRGLQPERAVTVEAGLQYFTKNKRLNARATYFSRGVRDAIAFYTDPVTFQSVYINQDKQDDQGLELETGMLLGRSTRLTLFYSYVDGKVTTKNNGKDTGYFNLTRRPKTSLGLSAGSRLTKRFYISTGLNYTGKRTDIRYDAFFNAETVELKSYLVWNLYAEYGFFNGRLKVYTDLCNITNTRFTEVVGYNTRGINGSAGVRCSF